MFIKNVISRTHYTQRLIFNATTKSRKTEYQISRYTTKPLLQKPLASSSYHFLYRIETNHKRLKSSKPLVSDVKDDTIKEKVNIKIETPSLTKAQRLKKAVTEYGATVIVFHVGISLISLGSAYLFVSMGLDTMQVFSMLGVDKWINQSELVAGASTFALAYAVHKVFAPIRISITLASVPFIVRYLRKRGFLKK